MADEEVVGTDEVLVVVLVIGSGDGEHLVGRRREQKHARLLAPMVAKCEEVLGQLSDGVAVIQQVVESLEFVEDDQVGLKCLDTGAGEDPAQLANQFPSLATRLRIAAFGSAPAESVAQAPGRSRRVGCSRAQRSSSSARRASAKACASSRFTEALQIVSQDWRKLASPLGPASAREPRP